MPDKKEALKTFPVKVKKFVEPSTMQDFKKSLEAIGSQETQGQGQPVTQRLKLGETDEKVVTSPDANESKNKKRKRERKA
jgi:hypothetical protein